MADWNKIRAEYIRGDTSHRLLAEKYGVSKSAIAARCKKEKWLELRGQKQTKTNAKLVDIAADKQAEAADVIFSAALELARKVSKTIREHPEFLPADANGYSAALERCKRICDIKSDTDIAEQQARIDKLRKEAQTGSEESAEGRVVVIPARVIVEEQDG